MYIEHFNLRAMPFSLTPDPDFLYLSPDHREALAAIQYGLLDGRGFMTLVGEVGTGKTTLLYTLLGRLGPEVHSAYVGYTTQSFEELLVSVLHDLGADVTDTSKPALLQALNAVLLRRADEGRTTAVVIDEAQNLSDQTFEELRLLSNFESYTHKMLQIVLVGQPELQERLHQHQLRQVRERIAVRAYINPMPPAEMRAYIDFRLQHVGASADALFSRRALQLIVRRAGGIPRRANILCHNALLFAYGRNLSQVSGAVAREAIAEMDERRPGLFGRNALRRVRRPPAAAAKWAAGLAAAVAIGVAVGLLVPRLRPASATPGGDSPSSRGENRPSAPAKTGIGSAPAGPATSLPSEPLARTDPATRPATRPEQAP